MADHVLVLGGGVGGMSAAHELAERGFSVTVIEDREVPGGKARSIRSLALVATDARSYRPNTGSVSSPASTATCPTRCADPLGPSRGVLDNLRHATEAEIARTGGKSRC